MSLSRTLHKPVLAAALLASGLGLGAVGLHRASAETAPATATGAAPMTPMQKAIIAHVNARLASLKKDIGITKAEEPAWHGFTQVSRGNATGMAALYAARAKGLATMNAVQNMESYSAIAAKQADDMNALSAAFQTLYAKLTPAQRKKVDARFRAEARAMQARHMHAMTKSHKKPQN
ncbi:Spy/CpxP family protein refolding chaperone [Acidiphilium sp. AL]|uniref:Spy/CpxP family protein refolding chaperone n=1 Tax=Acidiphilium iwatense TaxID=768198 RepID=A0ABS9DYV7_9PROT|nr:MULTISPECIES: Spy/CpxP family protein refolding chaperone [Acidiphilium]MCF3947878.1 Spy/CpxP family protein refolding chaperone [Acidiphilium iwatense]MCU4160027.1 Spy/CpxP family protein refolding chaperone [Acidiphilium sp. AL]